MVETIRRSGNMNRFADPTFVQIGIGTVFGFKKIKIEIGMIFVRLEVFPNYSQMPEIYFLFLFLS